MSGKIKYCCFALLSMLMTLYISTATIADESIPLVFAFTNSTYYVNVGKKVKLDVTIPAGEKVVKWKVSNKKIARISKSGVVKGLKKGKVKVTATSNTGKKITCTVKVYPKGKKLPKKTASGSTTPTPTPTPAPSTVTVYWTPNGEVYHYDRNCRTLSRSKEVYSGTIDESGKSRACKVCG